MHRFPNPGSDVGNLLNCFLFLYRNIDRDEIFNLHDMQEILVVNGLVSSSGAMGIDALLRGANRDLSRDRSYNQCKMYAELFRGLGWIQSVDRALEYGFTLLGEHVATATIKQKKLVESCFLGMEFPNHVLDVNGEYKIRPFATILLMMKKLNGVLSRDEMIYGPLSLTDDRDAKEISAMCGELLTYRADTKRFKKALEKKLETRGITHTTAGNYTRFPLGALRWFDWAHPERNRTDYDKSTHAYRITDKGVAKAAEVDACVDIRVDDISGDSELLHSTSFYNFYSTLKGCSFEIDPVLGDFQAAEKVKEARYGDAQLIFSPFQALEKERLVNVFGYELPTTHRNSLYRPNEVNEQAAAYENHQALELAVIESDKDVDRNNDFHNSVIELLNDHDRDEAAQILKDSFSSFAKEDYYPLVGEIFLSVGIDCEVSPHGVNSRRWDAIILSDNDSIPIEIKSPAEEMHLSVKAIRQAVENKIILQARQSVANKPDTNSLAIGFELPNDRAEVNELINDINSTYGIKVSVIGIDYLLDMAIECISTGKKLEFNELKTKMGVVNG